VSIRLGKEDTAVGNVCRIDATMAWVTTIFTGGQRSRTAAASFKPSMLPGMSMSVNSKRIEGSPSRISIA
jgi:hypothetical protein